MPLPPAGFADSPGAGDADGEVDGAADGVGLGVGDDEPLPAATMRMSEQE